MPEYKAQAIDWCWNINKENSSQSKGQIPYWYVDIVIVTQLKEGEKRNEIINSTKNQMETNTQCELYNGLAQTEFE